MKTAIVYYSMFGNTRCVAEKISEVLNADLIPIVPQKAYPNSGFKMFFWGGKSAVMGEKPPLEPYDFDGNAYDQVVFGSPVWAGTFAPPLRTFITENRDVLQGKRLAAFFSCSGGPGKVLEKFSAFLSPVQAQPTMILIDPKDKPSPDSEERIQAFCDALM